MTEEEVVMKILEGKEIQPRIKYDPEKLIGGKIYF